MKTEALNPYIPAAWQQTQVQEKVRPEGGDFAGMLKDALGEVNKLQVKADEAALQLANGQAEDVHQVMIAVEQAMLAMQLTVQIRNKILEAYQEIARMQI
ncbi:MAG TPA: flagellar hook-basal body complex protein FliE [Firmicutes bacterium]|nr:flagellar hook-basal body complex protein FliE [Bacillota bacterium]